LEEKDNQISSHMAEIAAKVIPVYRFENRPFGYVVLVLNFPGYVLSGVLTHPR
jgi:hypothetical protein